MAIGSRAPAVCARRGPVAVVAALFTLGLWAVQWYPNPDLDEGITMATAFELMHGGRLYADIFEYHPPGAFLLLAGIFSLFGASYTVAKAATLTLTAVTAIALDRLGNQLGLQGWHRAGVLGAWLALLVWFPLVTYNHDAQLASIWAAVALIAAWQRKTPARFALAGALAGVTGWFLQTRGIVAAVVGLAAAIAARSRRLVGAYLIGLGVALAPLLAWPFGALVEHLAAFPLTHYLGVNFVSPSLLLAVLALQIALAAAAVRIGGIPAGFWPLWWLGFGYLLSSGVRADAVHIAMAGWPMPVLFFALLQSAATFGSSARGGGWTKMLVRVVGASCAMVMLTATVNYARLWVQEFGGYSRAAVLRDLRWELIAAAVSRHSPAGEPIFATPYLPVLYVVSQRPNATRHSVLVSGLHPPELFADAIVSLERVAPTVVVRQLGSFAVARGFHRDGGALDQYLDAHYRVAEELPSNIQILVRLPPR